MAVGDIESTEKMETGDGTLDDETTDIKTSGE